MFTKKNGLILGHIAFEFSMYIMNKLSWKFNARTALGIFFIHVSKSTSAEIVHLSILMALRT